MGNIFFSVLFYTVNATKGKFMIKILYRSSHGMTMSLVIPLESSILFHTCKVGTIDPCPTS